MPRSARIVSPGYIYHITQRGNNRQYIFQDDDDYILYLKRIEEYRKSHMLDIFAYCLMGNHVHFIVRPYHNDSLSRMFRGVHMRYAQYYQRKRGYSGHVWQGRFYSCLLSNDHAAQAIRYVENNPVRAKMVSAAWQYPWSSAKAHMGKEYKWITLADVGQIVQINDWKGYLEKEEEDRFVKDLRKSTKKNLALGADDFILKLERKLKRTIKSNPMGRPRKSRVRP